MSPGKLWIQLPRQLKFWHNLSSEFSCMCRYMHFFWLRGKRRWKRGNLHHHTETQLPATPRPLDQSTDFCYIISQCLMTAVVFPSSRG